MNNRNLIRFNNLEIPKFVKSLFNDFESFGQDLYSRINGDVGRTNVTETSDKYNVSVLMPGAIKENISINVENNVLSISYTNQTETTDEKVVRQEWSYSEFNRSFTLPDNVDAEKIEAAYNNGVLNIALGKKIIAPVKPLNKIEIK